MSSLDVREHGRAEKGRAGQGRAGQGRVFVLFRPSVRSIRYRSPCESNSSSSNVCLPYFILSVSRAETLSAKQNFKHC